MLVHRHRRRSLTERGPRSKAERRARSTRSRTCRISPARTSDERSRESSECLEVGRSDSTVNVCYQLDTTRSRPATRSTCVFSDARRRQRRHQGGEHPHSRGRRDQERPARATTRPRSSAKRAPRALSAVAHGRGKRKTADRPAAREASGHRAAVVARGAPGRRLGLVQLGALGLIFLPPGDLTRRPTATCEGESNRRRLDRATPRRKGGR